MMRRLLLGLALVVAAPGAGRVAGGVTHPPPFIAASLPSGPFDRLEIWLDAVAAHKAGELDAPARQVAAWPRPVLDDLFRYQKAFVTLLTSAKAADRPALVRELGKNDVGRL